MSRFIILFVLICILLLSACTRTEPETVPEVVVTTASAAATSTRAPTVAEENSTPPEIELAPTAPPQMEATTAPFQPPDLGYLKAALDARLDSFDGLASYYVRDLEGGQVAVHNGDVAISGTSIVKIPILLETYRALEESPSIAEMRLITETATLSGNYTANLLMELIAGQPNPFAGAQEVTESMRGLGFYNTFIAVPYDLSPDPQYFATYATPANQNHELSTNPDSSMQTTVADMGQLLALIYECSKERGALLDIYAGSVTAAECREILDVMRHNDIDAFIEEGVPDGIPVAHKHGWVGDTHGDAALVEHPEHPYVLVIALHRPEWLLWEESTVIIADLSRLAYAHFTNPNAYPSQTLANAPPKLPTLAPTPALPMATIDNTGGAGLTLRAAPGGAEMMVLPEGSLVYLLDAAPTSQGGREWRQIRLRDDISGWVVSDFLTLK